MSIIRIDKHETNFLIIDKHCLENTSISFGATGLHSYLMGLPNGWNVNVKDLVNRKTNGRDAIYTMLKELETSGYLQRIQFRDDLGRVSTYDYVVYEKPYKQPASLEAGNGDSPNGQSVTSKEPEIVSNHNTQPPVQVEQGSSEPSAVQKPVMSKIGYKECKRCIEAFSSHVKGYPSVGRAVRALARPIRDFGEQEVYDRLQNYLRRADPLYASLERFEATIGQYELRRPTVEFVNPYEKL